MLPKKPRQLLYALVLLIFSAIGTTAIANNKVHDIFTEVASVIKEVASPKLKETATVASSLKKTAVNKSSTDVSAVAPMFMTIIQGADDVATCSNDGATVARFNLCGDSDDRTITLSTSSGPVSWQRLGGSCSPDINQDCPNTTNSCYTQVATGPTFNLDASGISATTGAEFRVISNGQPYYFKVKKSTITQTFVKNDFICGVPGRIQITGLSSAYEFSINSGSGFGPWQGPIFNNLMPGTYIVKARLRNTANTCEYPYAPIRILQQDIDIDVTFTDALCTGQTGTVTVTAGNVPGPYKYTLLDDTGTAQEFTAFIPDNPYTFSAVGFGTYTVQVETAQCQGDALAGIDPPRQDRDRFNNPITIGAGVTALSASAEPNNSFSAACGISSVDIAVYTSGGTAPYTYIVNGAGPSSASYTTSRVETVTSPGTYEFLITDANGCTIMASANVAELTPPDITVAGVDGTCTNGGARLEFSIIDAKGYDLQFRAAPGDPWSPNPVLSVAATAGGTTYNPIQVQYSSGAFSCIMDVDGDNNGTADSVTVSSVGSLTGTADKNSDVTCNLGGGTTGGEIEFNGPFTGGSGTGYQFSIDGTNFSTTTLYSGLSAGVYNPVIIDGSGCRRDLTAITINGVTPPTNLDFAQSNINCGAGTSDVQLTPTSTNPIATYEIVSPTTASNGTGLFTGLNTGTTYTFRITDDRNCSYTETFTPVTISSIRARVKSGGDLRVCTGATDGSGTYLIDGFGNNYTYNINGGPESAPQNDAEVDLPPAGAGTYTITVTDADTGCTDTASFDIEEPGSPIALVGNLTDMSCANGNRGRVIGSTTGGWGGYRYSLTPPSGPVVGPRSSRTFNNLTTPGNYRLTVIDAEGCTDNFDFTLTQVNAPSIALDAAATDYCFVPGPGATIGVSSTAGSALLATHQYRINGGSLQASPVFTGLTPGNYTIEVVDGNNCRAQVSTTVAPQLRVNASVGAEIPCGGADGQINVNVSGGYGMVQYEVSHNSGAFGAAVSQTGNSFNYNTNVPGDYVFRVTDAEGCIADSTPITLDPPINIDAAAVTAVPVSCGATDNGRVTITPDGTSGIPPYEVNFDGRGWSDQTVFSNLAAGSYPYLVRDSRGCETVLDNAVVGTDTTPAPVASISQISATCTATEVSGGIRIDGVTDGTENFSFRVEDNTGAIVAQEDDVARASIPFDILDTALVPGTYTVITLDANGCRDIDIVEISQAEVTAVPVPMPTPACDIAGFSETVDIVGGTGPFLIRLENDPSAPVPPNSPPRTHTFNGLQLGVTYTVEITDTATGCIYLDEIPPTFGTSLLEITATSTAGVCDTNRNGEIDYTVTDFAAGVDVLQIDLLDNEDGSIVQTITVTPATDPYNNTFDELAGDYQIIVTNLTDNCTTATSIIIDENLPAIDILTEEPANCNAFGQITVQGRGGDGGPYEFLFQLEADPEPSAADPGWTTETTFVAAAGDYEIYVRDGSGCTSFDIATVIQLDPDLVEPVIEVTNQCIVTAISFDIRVTMPLTIDTPRFTLAGDTQFGTDIGNGVLEHTFQVASPGTYVVDVIDANGCTSQGTAEVYEFLSASGDFSAIPTCNIADGTITIAVIGGSDDFTYQLQDGVGTNIGSPVSGDRTAGIISGVAPGTYQVEVLDNETGCDFIVDVQLEAAVPPVIQSEIKQDITCFGSDDGSIDIVLDPSTAVDTPIEYILNNLDTATEHVRNNTGSFTGLPPAQYQVEVLTARNCSVLSNPIDIIEPADFLITASAPDFTCEPAANRFSSTDITVTVDSSNPGTIGSGYQYSIEGFSNYQTSNIFTIVDNGSPRNITVYAIDGNGCQTTFDLPTINLPSDVVPTLTVIDPLNCANPEEVEISVTGTSDFTIITTGPATVADVSVTGGNTATVFLPNEGDYFFVVRDDTPGGCSYPLPVHTVNVPINPIVTITEANPVGCAVPGDSGALFIEVSDYSGTYGYRVFEASDTAKSSPLAAGNFDTNNFPDGSGDPARIPGLEGGSYFVEVVSTEAPFCTADSGVATIRVPNGQLDVDAVEVGNVTCDDNLGTISATGSGGWDTTPYEYRLLQDTGSGFIETVPFSASNEFNNLSSGSYQVEIRDLEGCTDTFDIVLNAIDPINAGIREPQTLVCPGGNNAVLEAFNVTTTNPGAEGGVAGAGYKYQLIYLNSNATGMPTPSGLDERDRSGLQDDPTFIGTSGGVISAGWYAIEITSSFNCSFVTPPYEVVPPPPVDPVLRQTAVPGCGGRGEMEFSIGNPDPDPTVIYEYRIVEDGTPMAAYADMTGISFRFPGDAGILYQVDVRKKNVSNVCNAVRSEGINMTDASGITLLPNAPDDISCSGENDGRIESFTNGGVGNDEFRLYIGDPVDAFTPDSGARLIRTQDFGTFEGLDEESTEYYIAVTSGVSCSDIAGPFSIVRPEPILFTPTETPVTCTGESDGAITIEVISGGVGLIQFAIAPNFNEFFSDTDNPGVYTFEDLEAGNYEILIQDENGCFEKDVITVTEPDEIIVTDVATTPETCIAAADGTAQLTITGGTPFVDTTNPFNPIEYYETKLVGPGSDGTEVYERNDNLFFDNLAGGVSYIVFVQDANMCETFAEVPIEIGVDLTAEPVVQYGCEGIFPNSTARVELQDNSRISEILFALDPIDPTDADTAMATDVRSWGDLPAGDHMVYIYHFNGCTNSVEFTIDAYDPLTLMAEKTGPNELTAIAAGGFGGYEYFFNGESYGSEGIYTTTESGTVEVRVVDDRGCVAVAAIPFEFTGMLEIPNFFTPNGDNENDFWSPGNREFFPDIEVIIYDRYGRVVAELDQVSAWDGLYEGKELPSGDYWYVVNQNDKRSTRYVGHFTLYR